MSKRIWKYGKQYLALLEKEFVNMDQSFWHLGQVVSILGFIRTRNNKQEHPSQDKHLKFLTS